MIADAHHSNTKQTSISDMMCMMESDHCSKQQVTNDDDNDDDDEKRTSTPKTVHELAKCYDTYRDGVLHGTWHLTKRKYDDLFQIRRDNLVESGTPRGASGGAVHVDH
jgi:hypothetical protein